MINWVHSLFHDPGRGWDPVPREYAMKYEQAPTGKLWLAETFERALGGYAGKEIVELGSGPGHYAVEFALRGASVTCIDISATYLEMVKRRMAGANREVKLLPGYMDHVMKLTGGGFDGVFSHLSWCYCMNDLSFARRIFEALKIGGVALIRANIDAFEPKRSAKRQLSYFLNNMFFVKLGHPHPPRGRIAMAFERLTACRVEVDYSDPFNDVVTVHKGIG